jgi:hypothetical protein
VNAEELAEAHKADLKIEGEEGRVGHPAAEVWAFRGELPGRRRRGAGGDGRESLRTRAGHRSRRWSGRPRW